MGEAWSAGPHHPPDGDTKGGLQGDRKGGSDKKVGLPKKRETRTVKRNETLLHHRRRPLSCRYKYRSLSRLGQAQA